MSSAQLGQIKALEEYLELKAEEKEYRAKAKLLSIAKHIANKKANSGDKAQEEKSEDKSGGEKGTLSMLFSASMDMDSKMEMSGSVSIARRVLEEEEAAQRSGKEKEASGGEAQGEGDHGKEKKGEGKTGGKKETMAPGGGQL